MKKIIIIISVAILFSGCYKDILLYGDEDFEKTLVINSFTRPGDIFVVNVTQTGKPRQLDSTIFIKDANVAIYEGDNLVGYLTNYQSEYYFSDFVAEDNHEYTVKVKYKDMEATGEIIFPKTPPNIDVNLEPIGFNVELYDLENGYYQFYSDYKMNVSIDDIAGKQFYMLYFYTKNPSFVYDTVTWMPTDTIFEYRNDEVYYYFDDLVSDIQYISAPIPTNVFYTEFSNYTYVFNDELFDESTFSFSADVWISNTIKPEDADNLKLYYNVINISEDLFSYYVSKNKYDMTNGNPFVEPVNIFSNVVGGYGLVTGYNQISDSITYSINFQ